MKVTPEQLQALLNYASERLGTSPETLAATLQSGNIATVLNSVNPEAARQLRSFLGNPQQAEQFLNDPAVREFLRRTEGK